jgi:hypothetical protein
MGNAHIGVRIHSFIHVHTLYKRGNNDLHILVAYAPSVWLQVSLDLLYVPFTVNSLEGTEMSLKC